MSQVQTPTFLRNQLLELERLGQLASTNPLMSLALRKRQESVASQLRNAKAVPSVPRIVLYFAGGPVSGTQGIDAKFAADVLNPFVEMVKTIYVSQKHGGVGARGPRKDEAEARLFLTSLPRGSFGFELTQPRVEDFIVAEQLAETLVFSTEVIASAADTDDRFAIILDRVPPRALAKLKEFLAVVAGGKAALAVESGAIKLDLPVESVADASARAAATKTDEKKFSLEGVFRGATLESWRFDFRRDDDTIISGNIADEVTEETLNYLNSLTNKRCRANLKETAITPRGGVVRYRHELLSVEELA